MEASLMVSDEKSNPSDGELVRLAAEGDSLAFGRFTVVTTSTRRGLACGSCSRRARTRSRPDAFGKGKIR